MDIAVEIHPELPRGRDQRHEGVPRLGTVGHPRAEADLPLPHSPAHLQLHRVVVQWDFGVGALRDSYG